MVRKANRLLSRKLIGKVSLHLGRMFVFHKSVNVRAAKSAYKRRSCALNDLTYYKQFDTKSIQMLSVKQLCIFKFFNFFLSVNF